MSRVLLKRCAACRDYTLQETCVHCGGKAVPNRPAKFSPEDHHGAYRRKLKVLHRQEQEQAATKADA